MTEYRQSRPEDNVQDRRTEVEEQPLPADPIEALRGLLKGYPGSLAEGLVEDRREDARRDEDRFPPEARLRSC